jgi:hypothetical protein
MQIHRTCHTSAFTILPNTLLQDRRLSYTARGLLADLLSRPCGWSEDGKHMADTSPQGRLAVAKALRELTDFGYYRVDKVRRSDGTFVSEAHVYDTPQLHPDLTRPDSGEPTAGARGANPIKKPRKVPTLPRQRSRSTEAREEWLVTPHTGTGGRDETPAATTDPGNASHPADEAHEAHGEAVATLFRVIRARAAPATRHARGPRSRAAGRHLAGTRLRPA